MQVGWIGLGKMGWNLCLNLLDNGIELSVYNRSFEKSEAMASHGAVAAGSIEELVHGLEKPRIVWMMVTAGKAVDDVMDELSMHLEPGDIVIDGGNSHYRDSLRRFEELAARGIDFVDAGTSGGVEGARKGACMMIGGSMAAYRHMVPIFEKICMPGGYGRIGGPGSGHFAKMIHNGIEYGMMQSLAEGFEIMDSSRYEIDFEALCGIWNHGSIIEGYLVGALEKTFRDHGDLSMVKGVVDSSGEGRWTVEESMELKVSAPVITVSLLERYRSRKQETYGGKVLAALRNTFGGHRIHEK